MIETGEVQPGRRCLWRLVAGFSPSCVSPHLKLVIKAQELSRFCSPTAEMVRLFDSNQNLFRPSAHNDMKQIKFVKKKGRSLFNKFITTIRLKASISMSNTNRNVSFLVFSNSLWKFIFPIFSSKMVG